jgi:hypothetical protein
LNSAVLDNVLARQELNAGTYDITYFNDPEFSRYKDTLLLSGKFAALQKDAKNCVPYCLFVRAMLEGLRPGETGV